MRSTASTKSNLFEVAFLFFLPPDQTGLTSGFSEINITAFCEVGGFQRSISQNDYSEAQRYSVGIYVANLLPDISSAVNLIQGNEVMEAINNLQQANQLTIQAITNLQLTMVANQLTIQATLRTMEFKSFNSSAHEVDDALYHL